MASCHAESAIPPRRMIKELGEPFSCGSNSIWRAPAEHWVHARLLAQILMLWYCSYFALRCSRLKILTLVRSLAIATRVVTRNPINAPERGESGRTIDITQTVHNDSPIDITPSRRPPLPPRVESRHTIHDDEHGKHPPATAATAAATRRRPEGQQK